MKPGSTQKQIDHVIKLVREMGLKEQVIVGTERTVIACVGNERQKDRTRFETVEGVEKAVPILAPYKMASREVRKERVVTPARQPARDQRKLTNVERILKIKEILEEEIRPSLQQDGGDIELVDVEGSKVLVAMRGTCASCPSSELTIRWAVEAKLREFVAEDLQVVEVKS